MGKEMLGVTPGEHRDMKGLSKSHDLRDNYTKLELAVVTLGEQAAKTIIDARDTQTVPATRGAALDGAEIAGNAARKIEESIGRPVACADNFLPKPDAATELPKPSAPEIEDLF
jgi:hypothetical protein